MAEEEKQKIWICLGDVKNVPLSVRRSDIDVYRRAEQSVNKLWGAWKTKFDKLSSEEVMARIAFQFARLYVEASTRNDEVNDILMDFERKLNDIIVKVQHEEN
ncbi:MAG: cell division protein ZapA [Muribaculaceae bacterium]|nr:cell division protein ZapA [Muribaculaceae bacterium]